MIGKKINQLATELAPVSTDLTIIGDPTTGVSKKITLAQLGAIFSGAVSFYNNLAGFPATGDINVIYCAKDTQKLYLWSGSAYVEVFPSQALLDTYQLRSEKGVSNGYASLDSSGKVPISQLPSSIMEYKGTWNAATNTPTLANGTGDTGDVYICNVAGTVNFGAGPITFAVGDYVIYSGTIWQRSSGAVGTVTSVAASITGNAIGITGSPVTTSGTLAFAFAGTGAQYIKGDGTLATFPSTIAQAERLITEVYNSTGATLTKGTIVYINGGQGNLPTVTKALATGDSTSAQTFGVVQADITNNNNGYVVVAGKISDLDTQAYTEGTQLYLSATTAGTWTSTKQYAPNHLVYIGIVVRAHPTQGIVEIKIQNGYELDELHNVAAQTPTNNDGLFWESATSLWKNKSIATVLGYTPQPQLSGTGFVKISGTTISYDNSTYLTTSAAASTYLPLVLNGSANTVDINGQQFTIQGSAGGFTSGRIIVDPVFSAIGYQNAGVFDGLKILTNGNAEFTNSGVTRFFNQVRFDSTLTNGTYTYTLPGATGTIALVGGAGVGTVTSVGLSSATSGVTIGSTPITTSGTITLAIATASGSQQGLLSSTDWTTFNNKQNALTNPVTGTGTTNYLPKFTGTSTIGNSAVQDDGTSITILSRIVGINGASEAGWGLKAYENLKVQNNNGTTILQLADTASGGKTWSLISSGTGNVHSVPNGTFYLRNSSDGLTALQVNASGNLGLGVTPSDWSGAGNVFELGSVAGNIAGASTYLNITSNAYYNAGYKYKTTAAAAYYAQDNGKHIWNTAPSGTAGNAISFTQAMTLNASGNLGLGTASPDSRLHVLDAAGNGLRIGFLSGSSNFNLYDAAIHVFRNNGGTSEYMRINASGNLSIGNTNDTYKLDVSGTVRVNGSNPAYRTDNTTSYTSLVSYLSGTRSWQLDNVSNDFWLYMAGSLNTYVLKIAASTGAATFSAATNDLTVQSTAASSGTRLILSNPNREWRVGAANDGSFWAYDATAGQYRLYINTSGNVGIGTTSPSYNLEVWTASSGSLQNALNVTNGANADFTVRIKTSETWIGPTTATPLIFANSSNTERLRITSGGLVGIGTSSPDQKLTINQGATSTGQGVPATTGSTQNGILRLRPAVGLYGETFDFGMNVGTTYAWIQATNAGGLGTNYNIAINPNGGNVGIGTTSPSQKLEVAGVIRGEAVNVYGSTDPASTSPYLFSPSLGALGFGGNGSERMRITSGGNLLVGTSSQDGRLAVSGVATSAPLVTFYSSTSGDVGQAGLVIGKQDNNTTTSQVILRASILSTGAGAGQINMNGANSLAFGTFSDKRLKENIVDLSSQLQNIMALRPVEFDYIQSEGGGHQTGFIAQEMQKVYADAVGTREDGMLTVTGWSKTEARLVKAIQELKAELDTLKNK